MHSWGFVGLFSQGLAWSMPYSLSSGQRIFPGSGLTPYDVRDAAVVAAQVKRPLSPRAVCSIRPHCVRTAFARLFRTRQKAAFGGLRASMHDLAGHPLVLFGFESQDRF